jgi:hypothetical protein
VGLTSCLSFITLNPLMGVASWCSGADSNRQALRRGIFLPHYVTIAS